MKNSNDLKRENSVEILQLIRKNAPVSKSRLAQISGLSHVTVHKIVNRLIENGICLQSEETMITGGRTAALFQINNRYGAILGLNIFRHSIRVVAYDYALKQFYKHSCPNDLSNLEASLQCMLKELQRAIDSFPDWDFIGIGVSMPGRCDSEGVVIHIPGFQIWDHVPLAAFLQQKLSLKTYIDNDNNACAIASKYNELCGNLTDYVYMQVGDGVGVGVVVDGKLFHGKHGCCGEIGHTSIMYNGPKCTCGNCGCIDYFLNTEKMMSDIEAHCLLLDKPAPQTLEEAILNAIENPKGPEMEAFEECSQYITIAVEHVFRIFDTQLVIVRCPWLSPFQGLFAQIINNVYSDLPWARRDRFFIQFDMNEKVEESATACLFLERYMEENEILIE